MTKQIFILLILNEISSSSLNVGLNRTLWGNLGLSWWFSLLYRKGKQHKKRKRYNRKMVKRESHLNWFEEELYDVWYNVIKPWTIQCDKIENHVHIWYLNQVWMMEMIHITVWQNKFCYNSVLVYCFQNKFLKDVENSII